MSTLFWWYCHKLVIIRFVSVSFFQITTSCVGEIFNFKLKLRESDEKCLVMKNLSYLIPGWGCVIWMAIKRHLGKTSVSLVLG